MLHISTTFVDIEDQVHGLEGGADGYLTDVLEPLELVATVKALLRARKAEEAAQISTRQWQATFDAISDGVVLLDRDGRVVQSQRGDGGHPGQALDELAGRSIHDLLPPAPGREDSPFLRMLASRPARGRRADAGRPLAPRHRRPDPRRRGVVKGGLCIASDITDRRRLEEELRRRAEELAAADRRKDEFLAMLAHELRNPLAPDRQRPGGHPPGPERRRRRPRRRSTSRSARSATWPASSTTCSTSRGSPGATSSSGRSPVDLASVLAHAVETARPLIEAGGHELVGLAPGRPVWLEGDPTRLAQVVANLLNNAAKYTDPGGRIALTADREGDEAVVRGARQRHRPQRRDAPARLRPLRPGRPLARPLPGRPRHRPDAGAEPGPAPRREHPRRQPRAGPGQRIHRPPARPSRPAGARPAPRIAPAPATPPPPLLRILVVDDSQDSARSLARVLKLWGHEVRVAHDGPAAIEAAASGPFDVILLDIGLPGMDGYQVAEQLREPIRAGRPGPDRPDRLRPGGRPARSRSAGFDDHLVKPVNLDRLQETFSDPEFLGGRSGKRRSTSPVVGA